MQHRTAPLQLHGLTKKYGSFTALDDVSLELHAGEVFGFLGPNGAGKSTTIRTMLNFLRPTTGSILVFGLDSVRNSVAIKRQVGYLAGDIALYESMTGRQFLGYMHALRPGTDWQYVDQLTDQLSASLDQPIHSLSKGNKQKIGLIQAFMHRPKLIILDEPTSGLDPLMKQVFYEMIAEASQHGSTVFVSSHDLTEVQKICDRAAFIRDGNIVATETIQQSGSRLQLKRYTVDFTSIPSRETLAALPGVSQLETTGKTVTFSVTGEINQFIKALAHYDFSDLQSESVTLEDVFMHYYQAEADHE